MGPKFLLKIGSVLAARETTPGKREKQSRGPEEREGLMEMIRGMKEN